MSRSANSSNKKTEAIGYSLSFSFEEALRNAVESLPPLPEVPTDPTERIKVMEMGVERGGIAGFNRIFVRVLRVVKEPRRVR